MSDGLEVVTFLESKYGNFASHATESGEYVPASVARDLLAALRQIANFDPQEESGFRPDDWHQVFGLNAVTVANEAINKATKGGPP